MNLLMINTVRVQAGLKELAPNPAKAEQKKRQAANHAARAAANRDLRSLRNGGKAKG